MVQNQPRDPTVYELQFEATVDNESRLSTKFREITDPRLVPIYHVGKEMSSKTCPDNIGFFHSDVIVRLLSDSRIFTDDGHAAEIFDKNFCVENFFDSGKNGFYISVLMCRDAVPVFSQASPGKTGKPDGCWTSDDLNRKLRLAYSICGLFSLVFLSLTLFLYLTLQGIKLRLKMLS